jgi:type I pantothenate kinase
LSIEAVARAIAARRPPVGPYIVGITGSVASGKSTLALALAPLLAAGGARVELIATDGFLAPNAVLAERGLEFRKGFPESYDLAALAAALGGVRAGPVTIPGYSHATYDVDPAAARALSPPDILLVEGLALGLDRPPPPGLASLIDCLVFIDAAEADLETWFVTRFLAFWEAAANDATSFYARFRDRDRAGAETLAHMVWTGINLPNLRQHIAPVRAHADLVVVKAADHAVTRIISLPPAAPGGA